MTEVDECGCDCVDVGCKLLLQPN